MLVRRSRFLLLWLLTVSCGVPAASADAEDADEETCPAGPDGAACRGETEESAEPESSSYTTTAPPDKRPPAPPPPPKMQWKAFEGCAIPSGDDIGEAQFLTVDEAKTQCASDAKCQGFTFEGTDPHGPLSGGAVWINLKEKFDCVDAEWIGYRKLEPAQKLAAPAPPPPPPPKTKGPSSSVEEAEGRGVALCLTGQVRMLETTHLAMEQYLLNVLKPDVFLYGPAQGGADESPNLYRLDEYVVTQKWEEEDIRTALYSETRSAGRVIDLEYLEVQGNWFGNACLNPPLRDNRPGSAVCMYYNQNKCLQMIKESEESRGEPYKYVAVSRFDFRWVSPHPPIELLEGEDAVWIPSGSDWEGGLNDRHAFMPRRHADIYLGAWNLVTGGEAKEVLLETLGSMKVQGYPGPNTESFLRARLEYNNINIERFPNVAYLTCTQRVKSRWTQCFGTATNDAPGWLYKEEMEHATRIGKCVRSSWTRKKMEDCKEDISHLYRGFR